jgi:hypothetical protein
MFFKFKIIQFYYTRKNAYIKMAVFFWIVAPFCMAEFCRLASSISTATIALMMVAASTSETSVNFYHTTRRYNPEGSHLHTRRRENLKSHNIHIVSTHNSTAAGQYGVRRLKNVR